MNNTPLPEPWDYCYEWDGPFGTRKFSTASHNGSRPDRSVPIYTPDQMHTHAAAVTAELDAEIAGLRELLNCYNLGGWTDAHRLMQERDALRADNTRTQNEVVMPLRERIKVLEDALTKIDAIRNDIIGRQKIGWSSHVYPLVAALDEAGYPGMEYEAARAALGDKT